MLTYHDYLEDLQNREEQQAHENENLKKTYNSLCTWEYPLLIFL